MTSRAPQVRAVRAARLGLTLRHTASPGDSPESEHAVAGEHGQPVGDVGSDVNRRGYWDDAPSVGAKRALRLPRRAAGPDARRRCCRCRP